MDRSNMTQKKLISGPAELYRFLVTPGVEVQNMLFASDDVICYLGSIQPTSACLAYVTEIIGAYVTAGARIHLYGFLYKLREKAIYTDTDSVIFIQPGPGSEPTLIKTGDNLGQMQSELKKGEIIVEVVCAGPKIYAYKTVNSATGESKIVCKVRGIMLNYHASQLVNFAKIKDTILRKKDDETVIMHTKHKTKRKKIDGGVHLIREPEDKTYRVSF